MKKPLNITRVLLMLAVLTTSQTLFAHNHLEKTLPIDGSVLAMTPEKIELIFEEEAYLVSLEVLTSAGEEVSIDSLPKNLTSHFSILLPVLEEGGYLVKWAIEGTDTHTLDGEFSFSIKPTE